MAFPADFPDAHSRHWQDAELLYQAGHWANADQLYGLSAECGLKAVMVANGMHRHDDGSPAKKHHRQHMPELWGAFLSFVHGRPTANLLHYLSQSSPFGRWSIHNRYAARHSFDRGSVALHREGALHVRRFYMRLKVTGYV